VSINPDVCDPCDFNDETSTDDVKTSDVWSDDEEAGTFLTVTHETNRNVKSPSCFPHGFPSSELLMTSSSSAVV